MTDPEFAVFSILMRNDGKVLTLPSERQNEQPWKLQNR